MFGKIFSTRFCAAALVLSHVVGLSYGAPILRRADENSNVETDLVPIVEGTQLSPELVDLWDQVSNLQQQVNEAQPGAPGLDALVQQLNTTKAALEKEMNGVAVIVTSTLPVPEQTGTVSISPSSSASSSIPTTTSASSTDSAVSSTITTAPSSSINTDVPVVTVVTQIGTSIVILASEGVTSTVTLATITNVQTATSTSSSVAASSSGSASASGSGSSGVSTATAVSSAPAASGTKTATTKATTLPSGISANSTQGNNDSGAMSLAPRSYMLTSIVGALIVGTLTVL